MTKKSKKNSKNLSSRVPTLIDRLKTTVEGLTYVSETDAPLVAFVITADPQDIGSVLDYLGAGKDDVTEVDQKKFFDRLVSIKDWFGPREINCAKRYQELKDLLSRELTGLKVYRSGSVNVQIYVVGETVEGYAAGFMTNAVET